MRLITLGDSLTAGTHSWSVPLSNKLNCELINFALPASQDLLQVHLFQQWLLDNDFETNDIVVWQIAFSKDPVVNVPSENLEKIKRASAHAMRAFKLHDHLFNENKIDKSERISLLYISPIFGKFVNRKHPVDEPEVLQNLLFTFNIIRKLCPKLLIIRGRDEFVSPDNWERMKDIFSQKGIAWSDDSVHDWVKRNKMPLLADGVHPTVESMNIYAMNVIYPKFKELGWI
jgi:hypothetical protein